jgi:hypothetical protein
MEQAKRLLVLCKPATAAGVGEGAQNFFKHLTNNYASFMAIPHETEEGGVPASAAAELSIFRDLWLCAQKS